MSDKLDRLIEESVMLRNVVRDAPSGWTEQISSEMRIQLNRVCTLVDQINLLPGEMTFTVRTKDRASHKTIRFWHYEAEKLGALPSVTNEVLSKANRWQDWQDKNPHLLKVPD